MYGVNIVCEPVLCNQLASSDGALVADLCVRCVWIPQSEELFGIHVVDTNAQFYWHHTTLAVLSLFEHDKKKKYSQACQNQRATFFTPLCVSVNGTMRHDVTAFLQWIANLLYNICIKYQQRKCVLICT